jgi:hypothetical protein
MGFLNPASLKIYLWMAVCGGLSLLISISAQNYFGLGELSTIIVYIGGFLLCMAISLWVLIRYGKP